ncbi:MAG: very short patch repair endonuclease [Bryobacteraceae bacterium]
MDRVTPKQRSMMMSRVRSKNTKPELIVRHLAWALGYRYRLHARDLPGSPDLVFRRIRKVVFVHGCFFHQHCCPAGTIPKTNTAFWQTKLHRNIERDEDNIANLTQSGWDVLTIWECELKNPTAVRLGLQQFLSGEESE